jgi:hypothetical protein
MRTRAPKKIAFNPIEGTFDIFSDNNFSYESVPTGKRLVIHENMQMIVSGDFELDGEIIINGSVILED